MTTENKQPQQAAAAKLQAQQTQTQGVSSTMVAVGFALVTGIAMVGVAGHVQAAALHDAAHDVRHATGFPCH